MNRNAKRFVLWVKAAEKAPKNIQEVHTMNTNINITNIINTVKKFLKPQIALLVAAALLFVSLFVPIATPKRAYEKELEFAMEMFDGSGMEKTVKATLKPSNSNIFSGYTMRLLSDDFPIDETAIVIGGIVGVTMLFAMALILLAILKKYVPVIILSVISLITVIIENVLIVDYLVDTNNYRSGAGIGFMIFAIILVAASAVWNIKETKKAKKTAIA